MGDKLLVGARRARFPSLWYALAVLGIDPAEVLIIAATLLFSLSIHESAHAWTADRLGDATARFMGRVTLNPLAHIDPLGTIVFPILGLVSGGFIFGWAKPVPVNPQRLKRPKTDHLLIAAAGPVSNVAAAAGFFLLLKTATAFLPGSLLEDHVVLSPLFLLCRTGLVINVVLAVFNLIPIPPLDGSWILSGLVPDGVSSLINRIRPYGFMLLLLFLMSGALGSILYPVLSWVNGLL